ncbi:MAG TPA: DoxX family protein [Chthoniobacterales bacterium]
MNATFSFFARLIGWYKTFIICAESAQSALLLLIRLVWGLQFAQAGWGKCQDIPRVAGFFTEIGIPFPELNAHVVAGTELFGGIFLALGLVSRLVTLPLIVSMAVAYLTTEREALQALWGNPDPFLTAAPFLFLFASILILVFGPGKISLDYWIGKKLNYFSSRAE